MVAEFCDFSFDLVISIERTKTQTHPNNLHFPLYLSFEKETTSHQSLIFPPTSSFPFCTPSHHRTYAPSSISTYVVHFVFEPRTSSFSPFPWGRYGDRTVGPSATVIANASQDARSNGSPNMINGKPGSPGSGSSGYVNHSQSAISRNPSIQYERASHSC